MINRYPILACILALLLVAYLCFALPATARMAADDTFAGCRISVADSLDTHFVTQAEISRECDNIMQWITTRRHKDVDLNSIESALRASDRIERVNVALLNNGTLAIDVVPMVPVARVFDVSGSYYINTEGKRISADPRYHVDVPVVVGEFSEKYPPARLLPLLSHIAANPVLDALVSTVKQEADGNILIIPTIRGHVINFGDTSLVDNKFDRLRRFYRKVMPVRGWETYDTLAVKWRGQVVATRRNKTLAATSMPVEDEDYNDIDDTDTMLTPLHEATKDDNNQPI